MQTVFNNEMVAHVWAQGNQVHGRSNNGQFFFEGGNIYSYGKHFVIAMRDNNGTVLFTEEGYSVTTEKHKSLVWRAMSREQREKMVYVPKFNTYAHVAQRGRNGKFKDTGLNHKENWQIFKDQIDEHLKKAGRARKASKINSHMNSVANVVRNMEKYKSYFGLRWKIPTIESDYSALLEKAREKAEIARKNTIKRNKRRIEEFRAGLRASLWDIDTIFMRLDGDKIRTSHGAEFPVDHALKAFSIISVMKARGKEWVKNGHTIHLGHFQIDKICSNGDVKAGCHFVKWEEIERIAIQLDAMEG